MDQDVNPIRRKRAWASLAVAAATGASAVALTLPTTLAHADPVVPPPSPTVAAPPADPNAPAPAPVDPNAPPAPPADPNAPPPPPPEEPGRINVAAGGFSYLLPAGWVVGDASRLNYGQALLSKETGPAVNGQPPPVANDTSVLLGRLDLKLFAGAEPDNTAAAARLASDMGEFFMPYPGTRINQQTVPLNANGMTGSASYYEVKFTDTTKPNGQIWAGVVGNPIVPNAPRGQRNERWFVVWLGTAKNPIDQAAAAALANSIRPWTPPPPPPAPEAAPPDPNAPPPDPNAPPPPPGRAPVGVAVPVETPVPEMMPAG
ncbi:MAG: hypothetical protein HYZ38_23630 [Mycobacterium sp.]|nr:hypothetical protein [Mycobacterium sp.]